MSTIAEFIRLAEARLTHLGHSLTEAQRIGDVPTITRIEADIADVQQTLTQLRSI